MPRLMQGDCLEKMGEIEDGSVDLILTDPPYGTTACKWDSVIPFPAMWAHLKRIIKPKGAIVLTASQPFTSALIMSNIEMFKYEWIWEKDQGVNFALAKRQPLKSHENVVIFADGSTPYYPIGIEKCKQIKSNARQDKGLNHISSKEKRSHYTQEQCNYPRTVQKFNRSVGKHPTQKPVALMEYLIKTYTLEGETVLDFTMGSGTTGVAARQTGRKFIGIEQDPDYFALAKKRIEASVQQFELF